MVTAVATNANMTSDELCPATMGMSHEFDGASGVCLHCGVLAAEGGEDVESTCVATMGLAHEYADGVCQQCGEAAPVRPATVEARPLCPGTMGGTCSFTAGVCQTCGEHQANFVFDPNGYSRGPSSEVGSVVGGGDAEIMNFDTVVVTRVELRQNKDLLLEGIAPGIASANTCLVNLDLGAGFATGTSAKQKKMLLNSLKANRAGGLQTILSAGRVLQDELYPPEGRDVGAVVDDILANAMTAWLCTNRVQQSFRMPPGRRYSEAMLASI
jgi:hypothetical protein